MDRPAVWLPIASREAIQEKHLLLNRFVPPLSPRSQGCQFPDRHIGLYMTLSRHRAKFLKLLLVFHKLSLFLLRNIESVSIQETIL
jgi:hypothetical protein